MGNKEKNKEKKKATQRWDFENRNFFCINNCLSRKKEWKNGK